MGRNTERKLKSTNRAGPKWGGGVPFFLGANKTNIIKAASLSPDTTTLPSGRMDRRGSRLPSRAAMFLESSSQRTPAFARGSQERDVKKLPCLGESHTPTGDYNFVILVSLGQGDFSTHNTPAVTQAFQDPSRQNRG